MVEEKRSKLLLPDFEKGEIVAIEPDPPLIKEMIGEVLRVLPDGKVEVRVEDKTMIFPYYRLQPLLPPGSIRFYERKITPWQWALIRLITFPLRIKRSLGLS